VFTFGSTLSIGQCVATIDHGRPVAGFAGDAHSLGAGAQSHFAGGLDDQIAILAGLIAQSRSLATSGERPTSRERAMSLRYEMVGALILSLSVAQVASALSNEILENVQRDVLASLDDRSNLSQNCAGSLSSAGEVSPRERQGEVLMALRPSIEQSPTMATGAAGSGASTHYGIY
jgi:hypothetical protein